MAVVDADALRVNALRGEKGTCQHCGKEFEKRTSWQKFCSENCRLEFHGMNKNDAKRIGAKKRVKTSS